MKRRLFLKASASAAVIAASAGLLRPTAVLAAGWNKAAFESKSLADALKGINAADAQTSNDIVINAQNRAESGATVPVEVISNLANTESIAIIAEKNTTPLVGYYEFANGAEAYVATRIRMIQSSVVRVVARAGGKPYTASRHIEVTVGGCGG
jgi:sulfur-oxidizing protein SoxY